MTAGKGGMGGESPPWDPPAPRTPPISQHQPSVGTDTLGASISHLHKEHPHHVQAERLQNMSTDSIHHPVGRPGSVYKGRMKG
jgi:hypothetical protein